jgi:redox-sensitive bicupin YhaK (pirin superfamily)
VPATPAPLQLRPDRTIYSIDGGWFKARWHFSFDSYNDPKNMGIGYMRVFNHDTLRPGAVWPMHPHRDIEGITYVVAGEFEHADSLGNDGVLLPGGVQRMRLGRGAEHSERNHSKTTEMQFIQIWILPKQRGLDPDVVQKQYTEAERTDRLLRFLKPEGAAGEGITVAQDVSMYVSRLSQREDRDACVRRGPRRLPVSDLRRDDRERSGDVDRRRGLRDRRRLARTGRARDR